MGADCGIDSSNRKNLIKIVCASQSLNHAFSEERLHSGAGIMGISIFRYPEFSQKSKVEFITGQAKSDRDITALN
jgi:hypothetical protein